jgi:hypothetical protein
MTTMMMISLVKIVSLLFVLLSSTDAFLDNFYKQSDVIQHARPDLLEVINQQLPTQLEIQLHIGNDHTGFLAAKDMIIELLSTTSEDNCVKLPGADGYFAHCSSGHRSLDLIQKGNFINLLGIQHIDLQNGCWEVCWVKDKPAGTLGKISCCRVVLFVDVVNHSHPHHFIIIISLCLSCP